MRQKVISILKQIGIKSKIQKKFFPHLIFLITSLPVRFNFENLGRFGSYSSKTYSKHFEKEFPFFKFNYQHVQNLNLEEMVIVGDCSFIRKSGKKSAEIGDFWDSCQSRAHKGQEISTLSVVDVKNNQAYHIIADQTPNSNEEKRLDFYLKQINKYSSELSIFSKYFVYDAFAYKKSFIDNICNNTEFYLISKAHKNADLRYLYQGEKTGKAGAPQKYDGKIDLKNINEKYFSKDLETDSYILFSAVVNFKMFKRNMKLVYIKNKKKINKYLLFFSTDLSISGEKLFKYYSVRFAHEFLYRDSKQFTGLMHCQSINKEKLDYHFNVSLTAVSLAKSDFFANKNNENAPFSMRNIKLDNFMKLLIEKIIINSENTTFTKNINHIFDKWMVYGKVRV